MFSVLRFRQGCLYFHFCCDVWVSLVLLKGLIPSALEGAIITRKPGRQCWKHNFPPPCPDLSFGQMTGMTFKPYCPLHFHPEQPRGRGKKNAKAPRRDLLEKILLAWIPERTGVSPWWFEHRGGGRADFSSSHLTCRSQHCWACTNVG